MIHDLEYIVCFPHAIQLEFCVKCKESQKNVVHVILSIALPKEVIHNVYFGD